MNGSTHKTLTACTCGKDHRDMVRARIDVSPTGCWLWRNHLDVDGYGQINHRIVYFAHRFSYEAFVGQIPPGLTIDHLCRVTSCVNPDHLDPVPNVVNIQRGYDARFGADREVRRRAIPSRPYLSRSHFPDDDPRHGTRSGYVNLKCRCERCRQANRDYRAQKRAV